MNNKAIEVFVCNRQFIIPTTKQRKTYPLAYHTALRIAQHLTGEENPPVPEAFVRKIKWLMNFVTVEVHTLSNGDWLKVSSENSGGMTPLSDRELVILEGDYDFWKEVAHR